MKLSTEDLKKKISEWLSKPEYRNELDHYTDFNYRDKDADPFAFVDYLKCSKFEYAFKAI